MEMMMEYEELATLVKNLEGRVERLESENARLKERVRKLDVAVESMLAAFVENGKSVVRSLMDAYDMREKLFEKRFFEQLQERYEEMKEDSLKEFQGAILKLNEDLTKYVDGRLDEIRTFDR